MQSSQEEQEFGIKVRGAQGSLLLFGKGGQERTGRCSNPKPSEEELTTMSGIGRGARDAQAKEGKNRKERKMDKVTEGKQRAEVKAEYFDRRAHGVPSNSKHYYYIYVNFNIIPNAHKWITS